LWFTQRLSRLGVGPQCLQGGAVRSGGTPDV
jgi:hypothetical protein